MITVEEKGRDPIRGDAFNEEVDYIVIGTEGDADMTRSQAIQAVVDVTPEDIEGILRANAVIKEWHVTQIGTIAIISMVYGEASGGGGGVLIPQSEAVYEFQYQAPSEHIYRSLATRVYSTTGLEASLHFCQMIKVPPHGDDGPEGITLPAGNTTNIWRINTTASFVDAAYESMVESMMGSVNSTAFKGRPPGSMRFVQCDSQVTSGNKLSITWGFQFSANRTGIVVPLIDGGNITFDKAGHELSWDYSPHKVVHPTLGRPILQPQFIVVDQVFPLVDFSQLGF